MNETDGNEKRAILAIVLSMAVLWAWSAWFAPRPAPGEPTPVPATESAAVPTNAPAAQTSGQAIATDPAAAPAGTAVVAAPAPPERRLAVRTDAWEGAIRSRLGVLGELSLPENLGPYTIVPIYRWVWERVLGRTREPWSAYGGGLQPEQLLGAEGALGLAGGMDEGFVDGDYEVLSSGEREVVLQRSSAAGLRITKRYTLGTGPYQGRLVVRFENAGTQPMTGRLWVGIGEALATKIDRYSNALVPAAVVAGKIRTEQGMGDLLEEPRLHEGEVSWFGFASRYFLAALVPDQPGWGALQVAGLDPGHAGAFLVAEGVSLAPGEARELGLDLYAGPKGHARLAALGHDLEKSIQWGFFGFFAKILYWLLLSIHGLVGSWGLAIIGLTLLVKLVFFPLTQKSFRSQQEMKAIQPLLNELREKYKDDREMQAQEQMRLFKEHGVNPMSGCLPMLIQMPIWFALYSTLLYSVDLYRSEFLVWHDLSAQDPYAVLPLVVGILMLIQQWMTPMTGMDPAQQKLFKFMPVIFIFIMFSLPSGLCLYITVNSVLSIAQQQLIKRRYEGGPAKPAAAGGSSANQKEANKKARK